MIPGLREDGPLLCWPAPVSPSPPVPPQPAKRIREARRKIGEIIFKGFFIIS
jgi:hypothetical protein